MAARVVKIVSVDLPADTWMERVYLVEIFKGLARTARHFFHNLFTRLKDLPTIQFPEMRRDYSDRFRGRHILKKREDGTLRCVACYMCQTACPADCIAITAGEHPNLAYEKYPTKFEIDLLRCVMCGFCVDACPKDAIWMTRDYELSFFARKSAIYGIEELSEKASDTAAGGPGYGYRPYYGVSPKRKAGEFEPSGLALLPLLDLRNAAINRPPPPRPPAPAPAPAAAKPAA